MSFSDIKGQEKAVGIIKGYMNKLCLEGGYIFSGPEGVGKKLAAQTIAKALNCSEDNLDSCDKCASCISIDKGQHPDIFIIDNQGSDIKIDDIRKMQKNLSLKAYEAKKKVFIIDNAHRMNPESSNALLKVLEEPPRGNLIILITEKPAVLFKTIVSRCKTVKFSSLRRDVLRGMLMQDFGLGNNLAHLLAYFSEGRIGYALKLKDTNFLEDKNSVIDSIAMAPRIDIDMRQLDDKEQLRSNLNIIATWFRDIYMLKVGVSEEELINSDRKSELIRFAQKLSFLDLDDIMISLTNAFSYLEKNINTRLLLHNLGSKLWKA